MPTEYLTVYREDRAAIKHLGGMSKMLGFKAVSWGQKGRGRYKKYVPQAWSVPANLLEGVTPLDRDTACAIRQTRSAAGRKAAATVDRKVADAACELGMPSNARTARALVYGQIDEATAKRIAEHCRHRHEDTNYDDLLAKGCSKDEARDMMEELD